MNAILIVDDDKDIVEALKIYLSGEDYLLYEAYNGKEALEVLDQKKIDLVLMDIMMPVMDGITATARLREKYNIPVIFLSAKSEDADKILGLNVGADDYITKPFNPTEVIARIRSQLRRYTKLGGKTEESSELKIGGIVMDDERKIVTVDGNETAMTPMEYGILRLLMKNPGRVFSSKEIYTEVWKDQPIGSEGVIAVHIRHLREKVEINPSEPRYIKVVWGQGYKMEAQGGKR
ncbi:MAG: response regulator transcription factor [Erysipelotrichales bacterium]|nr:response regulator transcription factor [Erysipelotrichales bacterium]MBQ1386829.1 response regulator transcription factor [Erysipelotrichales bacterium]MBQ2309121.1 response regulator transcription factor [Erysipelotrichales bacterium]MBQ2478164.1 response regulator transcription factor [Erysipelotrichales bacterium]MBQ4375644.1 response regulator transcription factor [Erysipelotrichales bacterium]